MLKAVFYEAACEFHGFEISGHAGYGEAVSEWDGNDIVCAAVSSCTMLVCNAITENFGADAEVTVEENRISLRLKAYNSAAMRLLAAFHSHLESIAEDYSNVKLTIEDLTNY
ncbi:MAG: ribosomal-processing cysteine protease Prp [Oscillospiraceae bacterium]|nr:ribosomal-processing cysteine protease Prp [Oscillospiraceae bacterium]